MRLHILFFVLLFSCGQSKHHNRCNHDLLVEFVCQYDSSCSKIYKYHCLDTICGLNQNKNLFLIVREEKFIPAGSGVYIGSVVTVDTSKSISFLEEFYTENLDTIIMKWKNRCPN